MKLYDIFSGEELKIAEKIQQRRLQMLVHSYIYYRMDDNIVTDHQWSAWAVELAELQNKYPDIEKQVPFRKGFEDWNGSSGAFLPLDEPWIEIKARKLLGLPEEKKPEIKLPPKPKITKKTKARKLF